MKLLLRPTVFDGDKMEDDYCVIHDGRIVGRIMLAGERQGVVWAWYVNPPLPIPAWCRADADSLEAAKVKFRSAWERFYASLTPKQIEILQRSLKEREAYADIEAVARHKPSDHPAI
jgi:hypothetical protein